MAVGFCVGSWCDRDLAAGVGEAVGVGAGFDDGSAEGESVYDRYAEAGVGPAPESTPVTKTDMATDRRWLTDTLNDNLDGDRQQLMIVEHVLENGWETHPTRLSSLMLAVVETTDAALSPTLTRQSPTGT